MILGLKWFVFVGLGSENKSVGVNIKKKWLENINI